VPGFQFDLGGSTELADYTESEQRNIDAANSFFGAPRDFDRLSLFDPDATWWNGLPLLPSNPGHTEHHGLEAIAAILRGSRHEHPGTGIDSYDLPSNRYVDVLVLADGDFVIRQHTMTSTTLGGKPYTNVYCFVFRFNESGKVIYLTEHWNTWHAYRVLFNNFPVEPAHPLG
jgi:ketosteroid isomerase-like protein